MKSNNQQNLRAFPSKESVPTEEEIERALIESCNAASESSALLRALRDTKEIKKKVEELSCRAAEVDKELDHIREHVAGRERFWMELSGAMSRPLRSVRGSDSRTHLIFTEPSESCPALCGNRPKKGIWEIAEASSTPLQQFCLKCVKELAEMLENCQQS